MASLELGRTKSHLLRIDQGNSGPRVCYACDLNACMKHVGLLAWKCMQMIHRVMESSIYSLARKTHIPAEDSNYKLELSIFSLLRPQMLSWNSACAPILQCWEKCLNNNANLEPCISVGQQRVALENKQILWGFYKEHSWQENVCQEPCTGLLKHHFHIWTAYRCFKVEIDYSVNNRQESVISLDKHLPTSTICTS